MIDIDTGSSVGVISLWKGSWLNQPPAMAIVVAGADGGDGECPIISEWSKLEAVVQRATKGQLCLCTAKKITRESVAENHEIVAPVVKHLGALPQSAVLFRSFHISNLHLLR